MVGVSRTEEPPAGLPVKTHSGYSSLGPVVHVQHFY